MKPIFFSVLCLFLALSPTFAQTNLFVAPNGNDNNPGTIDKPLATVKKAQALVKVLSPKMAADLQVNLRGGDYVLDEPLVFTEEDSGQNGFTISYKAYNGEKVVLSGEKAVKDWVKVDGTKLWKAKVSVEAVRQFYINAERRDNSLSPSKYESQGLFRDSEGIIAGIKVKPSQLPANIDPYGIEILFPTVEWTSRIMPIDRLESDQSGNTKIYFKGELFNRIANIPNAPVTFTSPFYIKNAYNHVDQAGEWSFNSKTQELFYLPKEGENLKSLKTVVPNLPQLLTIQGSGLDKKVQNLRFEGITFAYSAWNAPSSGGYAPNQAQDILYPAGQPNNMVPAALAVTNASNIRFEKNIFTNLGAVALSLYQGDSDIQIVGNSFHQLAEGGVTVGLTSQRGLTVEKGLCANITVNNNFFYKTGLDYYSAPAIQGYYAQALEISHNEVNDTPYSGICAGWKWDNKDVTMRDLKITNNLIQNVMKIGQDGGGIYTLGRMDGALIAGNYINKVWHTYSGIYLDQGASLATVENNVIRDAEHAFYYKSNELVIRNTYATTGLVKEGVKGQAPKDDPNVKLPGAKIDPPIVSTDSSWSAEAKAIIANAGVETKYRSLSPMAQSVNKAPVFKVLQKQLNASVGEELTINAQFSDEGLPFGKLVTSWSVLKAPEGTFVQVPKTGETTNKAVHFYDSESPDSTKAVFFTPGSYEVKAVVDDGQYKVEQVVTITVVPDNGKLKNVALGKNVLRSNVYNAEYEAKNLVDGDVATEWANMQAMGRYDWVDIDLGEPFDIGRVEVVTRQTIDNDLTRKFLQIQVSNKSTFENYTIVGSQDFEPIPFAGTWSRPFRSTEKYRYVRMLVSKQGTHKALAEIRVLSADTPKLTSVAPIIVTNLLINPGIEELTSAGPWASTGPRTTVFRTSKEFYAGTASAKVVRTPTAWYGYVGQNGLNLAPGQTYRFSAWVKRESGEVDMVINISQNGKKLDGKDTVTVATAKVGTQWTKLEGTLTLPAQGDAKFGGVYDNATVYVGVTAEDGTATSIPAFFFDEVSVSLEK